MSEWKEYKLGDIVDLSQGLAINKQSKHLLKKEGLSLLRITDMFNDTYAQFIDPEKVPKQCIATLTDIIYTRTGQVGYVFKNKIGVVHNNCFKVIPKDIVDKDFIYWFLKQPSVKELVNNIASGSVQLDLPHGTFKSIDIKIPEKIEEQKTIAFVFESLNDKIDLLHRQNKTLEQLAETLFKQWFVEEAEESWDEVSLFDSIELIGGGTPKTENAEYWNGSIKWLSCGDIATNHKNFVIKSEKAITDLGLKNSSAKLLPRYSTIISARGTVGKYCLLSEPMAYSQSNYGIKPKYDECFFFTYLLIAYSVEELQAAAYGSVFDTITTNTFKEHKIKLPQNNVIEQFEVNVKPYFGKMFSNQKQIQTLTKLRDSLLPKLMSGEVRVEI